MTRKSALLLGLLASVPWLGSAAPLPRTPQSPPPLSQLLKLDPASLLASGCGFASTEEAAAVVAKGQADMPLIDGLAPIHYAVTTRVPEAQRYFDQGMAFLYGFEFPKAERSFRTGALHDPDCAMCLWGEALAVGPYINSGPSGEGRIAYARTLVARAAAMPGLSEQEKALIGALAIRYAQKGPKNQKGVHAIDYANAMAAVSARWPADDMIMVLTAEADMNVRPWDYWKADGVTPLPWARKAIALVETVLKRNPEQTEAQHLYIHLTEASKTPGRAERSADKLAVSSPASAHLVHMPSHTYYRIGRFDDAIAVNLQAIKVDDAMAARLGEATPFYGYFRHHTHFIISAAEQVGDRALALKSATDLEASFPVDKAIGSDRATRLLITALQARAQFAATTDDVLAIPAPDARLTDLKQMWWALRAEALGKAGRTAEAMQEIGAMELARHGKPGDKENNRLVLLAERIALARIAQGQGNDGKALRLLRSAARMEMKFSYNEPPSWHQPVQSAIGALLLKMGDARAARAAFELALERRPGNGWSLWGLAQAQQAAGDGESSAKTLALYQKMWRGAVEPVTLARL